MTARMVRDERPRDEQDLIEVVPDIVAASAAEPHPPALIAARPWTARQQTYVETIKPAIDMVLVLLLLIPGLPLMLLIAAAIRISTGGPAIYRQARVGRGGKPFTIYKFCTMTPDRRTRQMKIPFTDRRLRHKCEEDPRVTRIGGWLRRTSLDELPQLFNVLRGEMSLVGPRPELPSIVARYEPWQHERHLLRPGITGWWQVNGRSDLPMHEHTDLDIDYVRRISPSLDLRILLRTARAVLNRDGAF